MEDATREMLLRTPGDTAAMLVPCIIYLALAYLDYRSRLRPDLGLWALLKMLVAEVVAFVGFFVTLYVLFVNKIPQHIVGVIVESYTAYYQPLGLQNCLLIVGCFSLLVISALATVYYVFSGLVWQTTGSVPKQNCGG